MRVLISILECLGRLCLLALFASPIIALFQICSEKNKQPVGVRIAYFNQDYVSCVDRYMYCSPIFHDNYYFICLKQNDTEPDRDDLCSVCGKHWHEHWPTIQRMSENEWLNMCKQKDEIDYVEYNAPMGYGDL